MEPGGHRKNALHTREEREAFRLMLARESVPITNPSEPKESTHATNTNMTTNTATGFDATDLLDRATELTLNDIPVTPLASLHEEELASETCPAIDLPSPAMPFNNENIPMTETHIPSHSSPTKPTPLTNSTNTTNNPPDRPSDTPDLPRPWTTHHDRAICYLDVRGYAPRDAVSKLRGYFPELQGFSLTGDMVDKRLRQLDMNPDVTYWSDAMRELEVSENAMPFALMPVRGGGKTGSGMGMGAENVGRNAAGVARQGTTGGGGGSGSGEAKEKKVKAKASKSRLLQSKLLGA